MKKKKKKKPVKKVRRRAKKKAPVSKKKKPVKKLRAKKKTAKKSSIPPGASLEELGVVTHYFPHVEAAVVMLTKGSLSIGDTIIIKGHTTDFKEKVDSLQLDRAPINTASVGQEIGLRVKKKVRDHDVVYKLII
jgi:putative protease